VGLKLNGAHRLLVCADDVNLVLGDDIDTVKKSTETLIDASKEAGLEVNRRKTEHISSPECRQNYDIKTANKCFENVAQFRYLGTTITNQNLIQEEIKRALNSGNACYHSVQNLLFSRLLFENVKIKLYKSIILPVVLYGCEGWCLTLKDVY
jgi:hypothetical protein